MTDLDILDQNIKKLAVVRCLIQVINNDNTKSMYFERDLYDIINGHSAYIDRTFHDIKNKLHPAAMNTRGGVFSSTGAGGGGSSDEPSDSGPSQYHSMNIPQVPIDNNNNNNDLNLDPLNLAGDNNNQPSDTNAQANAADGNTAVNQIPGATAPGVANGTQVIGTDWLRQIADATQNSSRKSKNPVKVYVGKDPEYDQVKARDRVYNGARDAKQDLDYRLRHANNAKIKDHAGKDKRLIQQQLRAVNNYIKWSDGTKSDRGFGKNRKLSNDFDIPKLITVAVKSGLAIFTDDNPGREFNANNRVSMIRLRDITKKTLGNTKYKKFDHIFEQQFNKKFPNGTFTEKDGDIFAKNVAMLFSNRRFYKRINLGELPTVSSSSGQNLVTLDKNALDALKKISLFRDHFLYHVIAEENRDSLERNFTNFKKEAEKIRNIPRTTADICGLGTRYQIPIVFKVYGDSTEYKNSIQVWSETHGNSTPSPAPVQGSSENPTPSPAPEQLSPDLSDSSSNLDDSTEDLSIVSPGESGNSGNIDYNSNNTSIFSNTGSGFASPQVENSSFNREEFLDSLKKGFQGLQDMMEKLQ